MEARLVSLVETIIFVVIFLAIGYVIALIYTKISGKTFDDLPSYYWGIFTLSGIFAKYSLISLLQSLT
jgi:Na+/glutamate symporter